MSGMKKALSEINSLIKEQEPKKPITFHEHNGEQIMVRSEMLIPSSRIIKKKLGADFIKEWKCLNKNDRLKQLSLIITFLGQIKFSEHYDWAEVLNLNQEPPFPKSKREEIVKELMINQMNYNRVYLEPLRSLIKSYPGNVKYLETVWTGITTTKYSICSIFKTLSLERFEAPVYSKLNASGVELRFVSPYEEVIVFLPYDGDDSKIIKRSLITQLEERFANTTKILSEKMKLIYILEQAEAYVNLLKQDVLKNKSLGLDKATLNSLIHDGVFFYQEAYTIDGKQAIKIEDVEAGIEGYKPLLKAEMERIIREHNIATAERLSKYINMISMESIYPIVHVINESPKKGVTTYIDILKGVDTPKMKSSGYDKLKSYGALKNYTKSEISEKIQELKENQIIKVREFKASFGRYEGLILSDDAKLALERINFTGAIIAVKNSRPFETFDEFLAKIEKASSDLERQSLIKRLEGINLEKGTDVHKVIKFIAESRNTYRTNEDLLFNILGKQIPLKYMPLILLNANLTKNQAQKSLIKLSEFVACTK